MSFFGMFNCVYILSCSNDRYYMGSTVDLSVRVKQHQEGKVKSTQNIRPVKVVFSQSYSTIKEARKIEYWLKKQKDKALISRIINEGVITKLP